MSTWSTRHGSEPQRTATLFQGFWHGPPLGPVRWACLSSFIEFGYHFHLYTYDSIDAPPGVSLKDANDIIPSGELFHFQNPFTGREDLSPFSDLFRFRLLNERGGWWSDVDTVCLSPDIPEVESAWASEIPEIDERLIGTSQLALMRGSRLSNMLYSECLALSRKPLESRESTTHLLTRAIAELALPPSNFGSAATFYPIKWIEAFKLWLPQCYDEVRRRTTGAMFLPIFQSLPQYLGMDVEKLAPSGSYLDVMCERFGVHHGSVARHDPDDVVRGIRRFVADNPWAIGVLEAAGGKNSLLAIGLRPPRRRRRWAHAAARRLLRRRR